MVSLETLQGPGQTYSHTDRKVYKKDKRWRAWTDALRREMED